MTEQGSARRRRFLAGTGRVRRSGGFEWPGAHDGAEHGPGHEAEQNDHDGAEEGKSEQGARRRAGSRPAKNGPGGAFLIGEALRASTEITHSSLRNQW